MVIMIPPFSKEGDYTMRKLIPVHHSLADWDFQFGATNRSLSAVQYVSAPTSLLIKKFGSGAWHDAILCRIPATLCLPQGEVRTWIYSYDRAQTISSFRNQAVLGTANYTNTYLLHLTGDTAQLNRHLAGVFSNRDTTTCPSFRNVWAHYCVFWYNGKTPGYVPALCVDVYREITGEWVKQGDTLYDTDNSWKDSGRNRAGFRAYSTYDHLQYWDDTEIWGPI